MINDALVWGAGLGSDHRLQQGHRRDLVADYKLWQFGLFTPQMFRQATVDRVADSYVNGSPAHHRGGKDPMPGARFTIFRSGLHCGQVVNVISRVFDWTEALPIRSVKLTFPEGNPQWDVAASQSIDQAWSTFEWLPYTLPPIGDIPIPDFHFDLPVFDPCAGYVVSIAQFDEFDRYNGPYTVSHTIQGCRTRISGRIDRALGTTSPRATQATTLHRKMAAWRSTGNRSSSACKVALPASTLTQHCSMPRTMSMRWRLPSSSTRSQYSHQ